MISNMMDASSAAVFQEIKRLLGIADRPWLDVKQATEYTGYSRNTILDAYQRGDLEGFRPVTDPKTKRPGEYRFHKSALDNWIRGKRQAKRDRMPDPIHPAEQRSKGILPI